MELDKLKELSEEYIKHSRYLLTRDGHLQTVIFPVREGKMCDPVMVNSGESTSEIGDALKEIAEITDATLVLIEAHLKWFDKKEKIPEDFKDDQDSFTALLALVHSKSGKSSLRQIGYVKSEDGKFSFFDEGWKDTDALRGAFKNPYKK